MDRAAQGDVAKAAPSTYVRRFYYDTSTQDVPEGLLCAKNAFGISQILLGSVLSGVGAYLAVRFLLRYLRTRTLTPFGIYCLVAGLASVVYLGVVR